MIFINILNGLIVLKVIIYLVFFRKHALFVNNAENISVPKSNPSVDIIVPAYNEEKVILITLGSLNKITYPNVNIIIVDDGSQDGTLALINQFYGNMPKVKVLSQQNRGKAIALNNGLNNSYSDIVVCLDADTTITPDIIDKIIPYFNNPRVAAVAGTVKVKNQQSLMGKIQAVEYLVNQNYEREVFESSNGILIIPGAIGAFRRDVLNSLGGYSRDTLTEDTDITLKILCNKNIVKNAIDVVGYTEVPASIKMFLRQRVRWKVGVFQVLFKYQKHAFSCLNKKVSLLIIPYTWLYCLVLPVFTSLADYYFFIYSVVNKNLFLLPYYLFYILLDLLVCFVIILRKEIRYYKLFHLLLQRFILRQLTFLTYIKIMQKAISGNLFDWSRSVRYGTNETDQHL